MFCLCSLWALLIDWLIDWLPAWSWLHPCHHVPRLPSCNVPLAIAHVTTPSMSVAEISYIVDWHHDSSVCCLEINSTSLLGFTCTPASALLLLTLILITCITFIQPLPLLLVQSAIWSPDTQVPLALHLPGNPAVQPLYSWRRVPLAITLVGHVYFVYMYTLFTLGCTLQFQHMI